MLRTRGLQLSYPGGTPIAAEIDFHLAPGEWVALGGPNGGGKSALALMLAGLMEPSAGDIVVDGEPLSGSANARSAVGILLQDPDSQLITGKTESEIAFPLENLGWQRAAIDRRVSEVIDELGIGRLAGRSLHALSGGEKTLVALGAALAARPRYLILDEPGVYLDPEARHDLRDLLRMRVEAGLGVLLVTQLEEEWRAANRRLFLADGELRQMESGLVSGRRQVSGETRAAEPAAAVVGGGRTVLSAHELSFRYPASDPTRGGPGTAGRPLLLSRLALELHGGETVLIEGESGSGKTTLLLLLAGVLEPTTGEIRIHGEAPASTGRPVFGVLLQSPEDQLVSATVLEDILLGLDGSSLSTRDRERRGLDALAAVGLNPEQVASVAPSSLSHGQRRRVAWCGITALEADIWLLDEPTSGLDEAGVEVLGREIERFKRRGGTALVISQDPRLSTWPCRRLRMRNGFLLVDRETHASPSRRSEKAEFA